MFSSFISPGRDGVVSPLCKVHTLVITCPSHQLTLRIWEPELFLKLVTDGLQRPLFTETDSATPTGGGQNTMNQALNSRDSLEDKAKKKPQTLILHSVLLLIAFTIHVFKLSSAAVKFRRAFKKIKAEIFLKSHVFRRGGHESKAPDIILRFGSALCIILSDGLQHSLITAG